MSNLKNIGLGLALAVALVAACATGKAATPAAPAATPAAAPAGAPAAPAPLPTYSETRTEKATAIVQSVDQATRKVSLKTDKGEIFDFVAGPQVKNLAQVSVGDQVLVEYVESLALEVRRADGTQPDIAYAAAGGSAKPGEMPAGAVGQSVIISASVQAIDMNTLRVTVKGPQGNLRILQARDPKKLANVKVGDMVYVTYTEALGISVEKVKPAAK